jgi:tRNA A37 threonylcarbamoyltransferase TsaD
VSSFFEPSIQCIVDAVKDQLKNAHKEIKHVVLVGGFAASDWLFNQVNARLSKDGLNVVRPEIYVYAFIVSHSSHSH